MSAREQFLLLVHARRACRMRPRLLSGPIDFCLGRLFRFPGWGTILRAVTSCISLTHARTTPTLPATTRTPLGFARQIASADSSEQPMATPKASA